MYILNNFNLYSDENTNKNSESVRIVVTDKRFKGETNSRRHMVARHVF